MENGGDLMTHAEKIQYLIGCLLIEMPQFREQANEYSLNSSAQRRLLRGLMNMRPPMPLQKDFLRIQDEVLSAERREKGVVYVKDLQKTAIPDVFLWQGDITRLGTDAIVDADNPSLLGCFVPGHDCIDNAIHSAAGLQLRDECSRIISRQGHEEPVGRAKITGGYNLPARHVIHTVGPIVNGPLTEQHSKDLTSCYRSCIELANERRLDSIAFCCISTGVFHFPNEAAAEIAVRTVWEELDRAKSGLKVVFNVFLDKDLQIYKRMLGLK